MADPAHPLQRRQRHLLEHVRARGLTTDDALAAELVALGHPCDRSTLARYRAGERTAPLGLLLVLLDHVDAPEEILAHLAAPYGLRVIQDVQAGEAHGEVGDRVLELMEIAGLLAAALREGGAAGADGAPARLRQLAAELDALLARRPRVVS